MLNDKFSIQTHPFGCGFAALGNLWSKSFGCGLLCRVLAIFAENQWKRLSMNTLRAKPSIPNQTESGLIKAN
jgi:hypothetical protein